MTAAIGSVSPPSAYRIVWRSPVHRAALLALFISGIAVSAPGPQLTLFLVDDLHASLPVAGLYYLTNLVAPIAGFALGALSDRLADRLTLFRCCAALGAVGWILMSLADRIWMPFAIGAVVFSVSGAASAQLFAAVRDELTRHPTSMDHRVLSVVRMAFTGGWIIGPVAGSAFAGAVGLRPLLVAAAVCAAAQMLPAGFLRVPRHVVVGDSYADGARRGLSSMRALLVFTGLCVLAMNGDTIKFAYLPIYMAQHLHTSPAVRGAVISVQPLVELALMPFVSRLAERFSPIAIIAVGAVLGTAADLVYAVSHTVAELFVGQVLMSGLWAALAGLGVGVAQMLYPQGVGVASNVFMSAIVLSGGIGGALGGVGAGWLGLPHVFYLPMIASGLGAAGLMVSARRLRSRTRLIRPSQVAVRDRPEALDPDLALPPHV